MRRCAGSVVCRGLVVAGLGWMAAGGRGLAQAAAATAHSDAGAKAPGFDVISVKPDKGGANNRSIRMTPDGFVITNMPVHMLLTEGFGIGEDQVSGEPAWTRTDAWDINAKVAGEDVDALKKVSFGQRRGMFLQILTERFGLKVHHETRELPVYELVVAKGGVKMQESKADPNAPPIPKGGPGKLMMTGHGKVEGERTSIEFIAAMLSRQVGRKVVDRTGLTGQYDFTLNWAPEEAAGGSDAGHGAEGGAGGGSAAEQSGPSLFTAVEEQLGLKLEAAKAPLDVVVVDKLERPVEN